MNTFEIVVKSYLGGREEQQDRAESFISNGTAFAVLCDGMGGYDAGAVAASLAVRTFSSYFQKENPKNIPEAFLAQVERINEMVYALKARDGRKLKCGTTLVAVAVREKQLYWISVGDSRLYLYRKGNLQQVTEDHNYFLLLNKQLDNGEITPDEYLKESPKGDALISCIGMKKIKRINMNVQPLSLVENDILLLASDGLYKALDHACLRSCMRATAGETAAVMEEQLFAQEQNICDNTTFVLIRIPMRR